jgi:L-malate glycosyltransferase
MANGLMATDSVELGVIAPGPVRYFTRRDHCQVKQWIVPSGMPLGRDGLPPISMVKAIVAAAEEFSPELVHIWGTEEFWGLLSVRGWLAYPSLLEMQGLKGQISKVFYGGLTLREQLRCIGIKELLKCRSMHSERRVFARWRLREEEIIRGHRFVDVQSTWVASQVKAINPNVRIFPIDLALRQPFYETDGWQSSSRPTIFCLASYSSPFKGLHVAIRALSILKKQIPNVRLRIAGAHQRTGIRQEGYMRWINRMIRQLDMKNVVEWLGPLNAMQIVAELKNAAAVVIPTFIENCCTAMQEAMAVGTPTVSSYAGGIPSLAQDEESCLFFPPGDEAMCAYQLERVLADRELALRLSRESRKIAAVRNDRQRIVGRQLEIYRRILSEGERD